MEFLEAKSTKYLDEMAYFLWDEFDVMLSESTIHRSLRRMRWTKKKVLYASSHEVLASLIVDAKARYRT